ncbi:MAG: four-carbon acid sugar kinase family protein [Acidimicrobiaceae bacterium]|nr:four-carbon acid sugar kinase family protein [Acidimicrobiaceae bacterium]
MPGPVRVIADDLTGAADAGVMLVGGERAVLLTLGAGGGYWWDPEVPAVTFDTATRDATAAEAAAAVAALAADLPEGTDLVNKIDSILRGHIAPEVTALREVLPDHLIVLAPAFPRNQRVTRGGVQHVGGVPVHLGDLWAREAARPPESIAALLAPMSYEPIHLEVLRGTALLAALEAAARRGRVAICDAETDGDLDRLVGAARACGTPVVWVGSAGLAAAVGRARRGAAGRAAAGQPARPGPAGQAPASPMTRRGPYLAVIGSTASAAHAQAAALVDEGGALPIELPAADLAAAAELAAAEPGTLDAMAGRVSGAVGDRDTVVTITGPLRVEQAPAIARSLATVTGPAARAAAALVLTGGATARAVLEAAGTAALHLIAELDPGIVLARPVGRDSVPVITKSGAFGDDRTLLRAVQRITVAEGSLEEGSAPRAS